MKRFFSVLLLAVMFACMAMFGYKTIKDLSFLGVFLFMGMIGLIFYLFNRLCLKKWQ